MGVGGGTRNVQCAPINIYIHIIFSFSGIKYLNFILF